MIGAQNGPIITEATGAVNPPIQGDRQEQLDKALAHHKDGLQITQEIGGRLNEAYCHWGLGADYKALGDVEQARAHLERAAELFEEVKSPKAEKVRKQLAGL
jgi:tetratricopeptide (TPR) repeat protein